ncbi:MAG TPA: hypothetical protein VLA19_18660 [Herpetosiphonaceae bacterium]|nr:hypothetical protein [Herpetosiphonaceae bacterium]
MMPRFINRFWPWRWSHAIHYSGADGKQYIVYVPPWLLSTIIAELCAKGILLELRR